MKLEPQNAPPQWFQFYNCTLRYNDWPEPATTVHYDGIFFELKRVLRLRNET